MDAINARTSKIQVEIATVDTDVEGLQNISPDPGENSTWDKGDLTADYDKLGATGVGGGGSISGTKLLDVLDPVDQFLQGCHNNGGVPTTAVSGYEGIPGLVHFSATGVTWDFDGILTKWATKAEKKNGWMVDFEFKLADRMDMNTADP